jgi:hypothetical protein
VLSLLREDSEDSCGGEEQSFLSRVPAGAEERQQSCLAPKEGAESGEGGREKESETQNAVAYVEAIAAVFSLRYGYG